MNTFNFSDVQSKDMLKHVLTKIRNEKLDFNLCYMF